MSFSNLLKQLKKKLRSKKGWLSLGAVLLIAGASVSFYWRKQSNPNEGSVLKAWTRMAAVGMTSVPDRKNNDDALKRIAKSQESKPVFVQKKYVCGEETQELGSLLPSDILRYHQDHPQSSVSLSAEEQVYFIEQIDDLSPQCKQSAYFGLDGNGNLSLFEGLPQKDQVIRTFFQLNVQHLKSSLPQETLDQLYHGIRISDLAEYNSVLSTFSDYASEEAAHVMNQTKQ